MVRLLQGRVEISCLAMPRPPGNLLESFVEPHLSDPSWDETNGAFGSLTQAVERLVGVIRNTSLANINANYREAL